MEVKKKIEGVKMEVASLKATVETCFRARVDLPRTAAVAEVAGDHGSDWSPPATPILGSEYVTLTLQFCVLCGLTPWPTRSPGK